MEGGCGGILEELAPKTVVLSRETCMDGMLRRFKDSGSGEKQLFQVRKALFLMIALFQIY